MKTKLKKPFLDSEIKELIKLECKLEGIKTICFTYSGSGDSGEINDIMGIQKEVGIDTFSPYSSIVKTINLNHNEELEHYILDKFLDNIEDWWNNEGGEGIGFINMITGEVYIENNINITHQETYTHDFDF